MDNARSAGCIDEAFLPEADTVDSKKYAAALAKLANKLQKRRRQFSQPAL